MKMEDEGSGKQSGGPRKRGPGDSCAAEAVGGQPAAVREGLCPGDRTTEPPMHWESG